ncbi:hypothetical protein BRAO375_3730002 [Bradyrhizobium sp. ORS 375]|nr:hypothetical protein BRAO375_3730002 [Bradyrhizobium sp. ORS 375]
MACLRLCRDVVHATVIRQSCCPIARAKNKMRLGVKTVHRADIMNRWPQGERTHASSSAVIPDKLADGTRRRAQIRDPEPPDAVRRAERGTCPLQTSRGIGPRATRAVAPQAVRTVESGTNSLAPNSHSDHPGR